MEFFGFLILAVLLAPYGIGAWAHVRAARLERHAKLRDVEIAALRGEIEALRRGGEPNERDETAADGAFAHISPSEAVQAAAEPPSAEEPDAPEPQGRRWAAAFSRETLERQFGAVLPVWIGGVALALSGFFLVKYSIENDLIGPQTRVLLGALLGFALIGASRWIAARTGVEAAGRITQALTGAGLAVLYVSAYAGTTLYELLPRFIGFGSIAAITAFSVVLALRNGPAIALLGMLGGFLTPALMASGNPQAMLFFAYLFFIFAALILLIRRRGWWLMAIPAVIAAFAWVLAWIAMGVTGGSENIWLSLFLIAVAGTIVAASRERYGEEMAEVRSWRDLVSFRRIALAVNVFSVAGAMGIMALIGFSSGFALQDWLFFAVLALGAVALAWFSPALYGFAPWAAMAVCAAMLAGWTPDDRGELMAALALFGGLYVLSGFLLIAGSATPLLWAGLSVSAALGYYLIGFFRLTPAPPKPPEPIAINIPPSTEPSEPLVEEIREIAAAVQHEWAVLAMGLALAFLGAAVWASRRFPDSLMKDRILALYALAASAFVALALFVELDREFLAAAIAAEVLAVAWVAGRTGIATLRPVAGLLGVAFAFLLIPQILLLGQLSLYSVFEIEWRVQESVPIVDFPSFQLALPAACFFIAAYLLRQTADGLLVRTLEAAGVALVALWGFYATAHLFHPGENVLFAQASFLERGVITNVLFVYGVACLLIARHSGRGVFFLCGVLLAVIALFRIVYFDLWIKNPAWHGGEVAGPLPFDALALTLLVPMLWSWLAAKEIARGSASPRFGRIARAMTAIILVLAFSWLTLAIRKFYQGPVLDGPVTGDAEFYSYSAAWLVFALALLFYGALRGGQLLRYASLAVLLAAVTKVFLLDAGHLTGLYRVFSFLGLGLSLLGIGYFYSRFVFGKVQEGEEGAEARPETPA